MRTASDIRIIKLYIICCAAHLFKKHNFYKGTPSLAGRFLFQNSPPDCFEIHLLRSACYCLWGFAPHLHQRLCLWNPLKGYQPFRIPLFIFRFRRSSRELVQTDRLRYSLPTPCWASRNQPPFRSDSGNISQISRDKAATPW